MKNILVPTDFSACARYAEAAALQLASRFGAKLHFIHILPPSSGREEEEARKKANREILLRDIQHRNPDAHIETACLVGPLPEQVERAVHDRGIDLIVMGSHGASGKNEYFIGSNTQRVVRRIHCPVLVVKDPVPALSFNKVVFAARFSESEREPFLRFKDFVKRFMPRIHLVAIHTSSLFEAPYVVTKSAMDEFKALCDPLPSEVHVFRDLNIEEGIRLFADAIGADLIGISNHDRRPLKRMLVGSNVEALVNHASLPVLVIDYES